MKKSIILFLLLSTYLLSDSKETRGDQSPIISSKGNVIINYNNNNGGDKNETKLSNDEIEFKLYQNIKQGKLNFTGILKDLSPNKLDFQKIFKKNASKLFIKKYPKILEETINNYNKNVRELTEVNKIKINPIRLKSIIEELKTKIDKMNKYSKKKASKMNLLAFYKNFNLNKNPYMYKIYIDTLDDFALGKDGKSIIYRKPRILYGFKGSNEEIIIIDVVSLYHKAFEKVYYIPTT